MLGEAVDVFVVWTGAGQALIEVQLGHPHAHAAAWFAHQVLGARFFAEDVQRSSVASEIIVTARRRAEQVQDVPIPISVVGVMVISVARSVVSVRSLFTSVLTRTAGIGLLSGTFFGVSAVAYRSASLALAPSLPAPDYAVQASYTLVFVIILQTVLMFGWILARERDELPRIAAAWRPALLVGFVGATASFGWFMAMTLQQAAVVKALAQVEMLFTFASTVFIFKERINRLEILGCALIVVGVLALLFYG